jgi:hypothetical protein
MPNELLHRSNAGVEVGVVYTGDETLILTVGVDGASAATIVPPARVLDAFEHPFVYLDDAQVERLFPKTTSAV